MEVISLAWRSTHLDPQNQSVLEKFSLLEEFVITVYTEHTRSSLHRVYKSIKYTVRVCVVPNDVMHEGNRVGSICGTTQLTGAVSGKHTPSNNNCQLVHNTGSAAAREATRGNKL